MSSLGGRNARCPDAHVRDTASAGARSDSVRAGPDVRLVPAAALVWVSGLAGALVGWWCAPLLGGLAVVAALMLLRIRVAVGLAAALLVCGLLAVGVLGISLHRAETDPLRSVAESGGTAEMRLTVAERPRPIRAAGYADDRAGSVVMVATEADQVVVGKRLVERSGRVLVVARADGWASLLPGQMVTAEGSLSAARGGDMTVAVLHVRSPPLAVTPAPWWQEVAARFRAAMRDATQVLEPEEAGLLPGLVIGDTARMTPQLQEEFRDAGLAHLVAVSGSNLVVVCGAALAVTRAVRLGPRTSAIAAGAVLTAFVIVVGYEPSVLRAGVMAAVGLMALCLGREGSAVPALCVAVVLLVLLDPAMAVNVGFALSVVATAALVLVAPGWVEALRRRRVPRVVAEGLVVPLVAFVATVPILAGVTGEVGLMTVAANVLAAPVVPLATVLGFVAVLTAPLLSWLAEIFVYAAGPEMTWLIVVARHAAAVPGAVVSWPDGWWGGLLAMTVCGVVVVLLHSRRWRLVATTVVLVVAVVVVPAKAWRPGWPPPGWVMVACDVGQGDGLVLATGRPGEAVVVDTGTELGHIDDCLDQLGIATVPVVLLSHLHADHVGGLAAVVEGRSVGGVAVGDGRSPGWAWREVQQIADRRRLPLLRLRAGEQLRWPQLTVDVLGPRHLPKGGDDGRGGEEGTVINNASVVLRATTPVGRVLLTGDIEQAAQAGLLAAGVDLRADVLKVPHHGSRYTLPDFLAAVAPRVAIISVGADNRYGHPSPMLVKALRSAGVLVARTDVSGDVAVAPGPNGALSVHGERAQPSPGRGLPIGVHDTAAGRGYQRAPRCAVCHGRSRRDEDPRRQERPAACPRARPQPLRPPAPVGRPRSRRSGCRERSGCRRQCGELERPHTAQAETCCANGPNGSGGPCSVGPCTVLAIAAGAVRDYWVRPDR